MTRLDAGSEVNLFDLQHSGCGDVLHVEEVLAHLGQSGDPVQCVAVADLAGRNRSSYTEPCPDAPA